MNKICLIIWSCFLGLSCSAQSHVEKSSAGKSVAFPGAEGYGKYATGGRGGKVLIVSNLNDHGPGSLREAVKEKTPRMVVFAVSGTIHLESKLTITSDITIAGQTAPGGGICIADYPVNIKGRNIIIRYLRFRMGDKNQRGGMVHGNGSDDAFGGIGNNNLIIDHCTMSWSTDEACTIYGGDSTTLQWNLISEPLDYSYHFEEGDKDYEHHGYGGIWGGKHTSGHHNLFAHCASRTPRFDGARNITSEFVDFRNNVIYNWRSNNSYAGEGGSYNMVNNYYKYGPSTSNKVKNRVVNPYKDQPRLNYGRFYLSGNFVDGEPPVSNNNWLGVTMNGGSMADTVHAKTSVEFPGEAVQTQSAAEAYELVLKTVGASLPERDTLDQRIIENVRQRTGDIINVQGGFPHGTDYNQTVKAWPTLRSLPAALDTDCDGMPDRWEQANHLDPKDGSDAAKFKLDKAFTNIEVYINSL